MDFGLVPPEIHSALMYAGPGPAPISAAAAVWDGLAAELDSASASYGSVVTDLTSMPWRGASSVEMASAVAPYVSWMHTTAVQAAETAAQIRAGVAAYEDAFAATVPPPVIAANRAELLTLIATNIFGQNTAAIGVNQAEYAEMWAQDAAAMYGYAAAASTVTRLQSFTPPAQVSGVRGPADDMAGAAQAADGAQGVAQQGLQAVPQMLEQLALPAQAVPAQAAVDGVVGDAVGEVATASAVSSLSAGSVYHGAIGSINFFQRTASQFAAQFTTASEPSATEIMEKVNRIGLATGAIDPEELEAADAAAGGLGHYGGFGDWHNWERWLRQLGSRLGHAFLSAQTGQAPSVGGLSVPHAWTAAAPELQLAALDIPHVPADSAADAAPMTAGGVEGGGAGNLFAGTAAASMVGRALAGSAGSRERLAGRERVKPPPRRRPDAGAIAELREVAELLREFGELRDAGLLSDTEFNEQKRQLIGQPVRTDRSR